LLILNEKLYFEKSEFEGELLFLSHYHFKHVLVLILKDADF